MADINPGRNKPVGGSTVVGVVVALWSGLSVRPVSARADEMCDVEAVKPREGKAADAPAAVPLRAAGPSCSPLPPVARDGPEMDDESGPRLALAGDTARRRDLRLFTAATLAAAVAIFEAQDAPVIMAIDDTLESKGAGNCSCDVAAGWDRWFSFLEAEGTVVFVTATRS